MQNSTEKMKKNRKFNYSIAKKWWRFLAEILRLKSGAIGQLPQNVPFCRNSSEMCSGPAYRRIHRVAKKRGSLAKICTRRSVTKSGQARIIWTWQFRNIWTWQFGNICEKGRVGKSIRGNPKLAPDVAPQRVRHHVLYVLYRLGKRKKKGRTSWYFVFNVFIVEKDRSGCATSFHVKRECVQSNQARFCIEV